MQRVKPPRVTVISAGRYRRFEDLARARTEQDSCYAPLLKCTKIIRWLFHCRYRRGILRSASQVFFVVDFGENLPYANWRGQCFGLGARWDGSSWGIAGAVPPSCGFSPACPETPWIVTEGKKEAPSAARGEPTSQRLLQASRSPLERSAGRKVHRDGIEECRSGQVQHFSGEVRRLIQGVRLRVEGIVLRCFLTMFVSIAGDRLGRTAVGSD